MKVEIVKVCGHYIWQVVDREGFPIATGRLAYTRRFSAMRGFRRLWAAQVVEVAK
jgi:hypothetical protein